MQDDDTGHTVHLHHFITTKETWDKYVHRMRKPKQWGGHLELVAAANLFQVPICIITDQPAPQDPDVWIRPPVVVTENVLLLGFDSQSCHYHSLEGELVN